MMSSSSTKISLAVLLPKIISIIAGEIVGLPALDIINNFISPHSEPNAEESHYQEADGGRGVSNRSRSFCSLSLGKLQIDCTNFKIHINLILFVWSFSIEKLVICPPEYVSYAHRCNLRALVIALLVLRLIGWSIPTLNTTHNRWHCPSGRTHRIAINDQTYCMHQINLSNHRTSIIASAAAILLASLADINSSRLNASLSYGDLDNSVNSSPGMVSTKLKA